MITGFNTDIKHDGVTYHVQTEDKGLKTPLILSLVYQGGTILASKRSPYEDLVLNFDEKVLEDRLNRQHNLICAAIRAGRIEDLKRMTLEASSAKNKNTKTSSNSDSQKQSFVEEKKDESKALESKQNNTEEIVKTDELVNEESIELLPIKKSKETTLPEIELEISEKETDSEQINELLIETDNSSETSKEITPKVAIEKEKKAKSFVPETPKPIAEKEFETELSSPNLEKEKAVEETLEEDVLEAGIPKPTEEPVWDIPIIEDVTIVDESDVTEEEVVAGEIILPPDAVEIVGDLEQFGSLLEDELKVKILGGNQFRSGDRKNINVLICRGSEDSAVADANVMVKIIGSDFRPLIYHSKADTNGIATVFLKLPVFRSGRAAVLIRAMVDGEETELRRAISPE